MLTTLGIMFAIAAMFAWGVGDFTIQKSLRKFGDWETLFIISALGSIVLIFFVWRDVIALFSSFSTSVLILLAAGITLLVAAIMEFEALKRGKLSVIEPTWSMEIPMTVLLAFLVLGETLGFFQIVVIVGLVVGLVLVSYQGNPFSKKFLLERGVMLSIFAALVMGAANFFVGWGARASDPLVVNFVISFISMLGSGIVLLWQGKFIKCCRDTVREPRITFTMAVLDNIAWIAFAFAMTLAPIGIAAALSESYIIIAVILGLFVNKEKLERHQKIGLIIAVIAAVIIASQV